MLWAVCFFLLVQIVPVFAQETKNERVNFSSGYTDLSKDCSWAYKEKELQEGQDNALNCKGFGGYTGFIYFSAMGNHFTLKKGLKSQNYLLSNAIPIKNYEKGIIEWRLANNVPFAIIARGPESFEPEGPKGEILFIRGIGKYSGINLQIDVSKNRNPNEEARKLADNGYFASEKDR